MSQPLGGWLADRFGRRATMVGGLLGTAASMGLLAVSRSLPLIAVTALLTGVATDIYRPASSAAVADLIPVRTGRGRSRSSTGRSTWASRSPGSSAACWPSGAGGSSSPPTPRPAWSSPSWSPAACPRPGRSATPGESAGYGPVLRDRLAVSLAAMAFVSGVVYLQTYIALPLAMTGDGLSPAAYGVAYAVNPVTVLLVQPLTLRWLSARPPARVYAASTMVLGIGFGLTYFAHSVLAYGATVFIWTLGEVGFNAIGPDHHQHDRPGHAARPLQRADRAGLRRRGHGGAAGRHLDAGARPGRGLGRLPGGRPGGRGLRLVARPGAAPPDGRWRGRRGLKEGCARRRPRASLGVPGRGVDMR